MNRLHNLPKSRLIVKRSEDGLVQLPDPRTGWRAERRGPSCALGLGVVSKKYALTAPYYVYRIAFRSHDIPKLRASHWIPSVKGGVKPDHRGGVKVDQR